MTDTFTKDFELEKTTFNLFNITEWRQFLIENKIMITIVGFVIAGRMTKLIEAFFDDIILVCNDPNNNNNTNNNNNNTNNNNNNTNNNNNNNNNKNNKNSNNKCSDTFVDKLYKYKITINNYTIYIGRFITTLLKFIISVILIFYISRLFNDIIN